MKKILILTFVISAVSFTACSAAKTTTKAIIETAIEPETLTDSVDSSPPALKEAVWVELGKLETYPEFRASIDEIFEIKKDSLGKNGCMYIDMNEQVTDNSTLSDAFRRPEFINILFENQASIEKWMNATKKLYTDVDSEKDTMLAMIDAYFCLFNNGTQQEFKGSQTLTRAEFLSGVYKANSPVKTLETNIKLNYDEMSPFVNQMLHHSYFNLQDGSMNENTYHHAITRAEAIYTLISMFYNDQLAAVGDDFEVSFADAKHGGYNTDVSKNKSVILSQALQNPEKGMPGHLYRALAVAEANDIVDGVESRWDESITKSEAIEMILRVYLDKETWTDHQEDEVKTEDTADQKQESADVNNLMILVTEDGRIACSQELADSVKNSVNAAGLNDTLSGQVLSNYAEITKGMDNSVIHQDVIDNIIDRFKKIIETQTKIQEEQREQTKKEQHAPENNNPTNHDVLPGEITIDISPGKGGDGGELISDGKLNSN